VHEAEVRIWPALLPGRVSSTGYQSASGTELQGLVYISPSEVVCSFVSVKPVVA